MGLNVIKDLETNLFSDERVLGNEKSIEGKEKVKAVIGFLHTFLLFCLSNDNISSSHYSIAFPFDLKDLVNA
jgi:hypothetical protein